MINFNIAPSGNQRPGAKPREAKPQGLKLKPKPSSLNKGSDDSPRRIQELLLGDGNRVQHLGKVGLGFIDFGLQLTLRVRVPK